MFIYNRVSLLISAGCVLVIHATVEKKTSCLFSWETASVYVTGEPLAAQADTLGHQHRHRRRVSHLAFTRVEHGGGWQSAQGRHGCACQRLQEDQLHSRVVMFHRCTKHQSCSFWVTESTAQPVYCLMNIQQYSQQCLRASVSCFFLIITCIQIAIGDSTLCEIVKGTNDHERPSWLSRTLPGSCYTWLECLVCRPDKESISARV